ncbi:HEAT repeat domain-containing protein [Methanocella sp. MCL-LM]|uniref:HEAT repeat domain-containing protein n=1 Tax=Methanocella sp. MCL-LM TaxID=3412035 RepID=UPI003C75C011
MIGLLTDASPRVRMAAAEALGRTRDHRAIGPLLALQTDDSRVAAAALDAIGMIGGDRSISALIRVVNESRDLTISEHAIIALGKIGDERALDPLIVRLHDRSDFFYARKLAARALYAIYSRGSLSERGVEKVMNHWHAWYLF